MGARPEMLIAVDAADLRALVDEVRALRDELRSEKAEELLSTQEAAELARVKPDTIYSWVHRGQLGVARRRGNRMLFRREDVLTLTDPQSQPR